MPWARSEKLIDSPAAIPDHHNEVIGRSISSSPSRRTISVMTGVRGLDSSSTSSASSWVIRRLLRSERGFPFEASAGFDGAWDLDKLYPPKGTIEERLKSIGRLQTGAACMVPKCFR